MQKTVAYHTLGCKLNFTDTAAIAQQMQTAGYHKVAFEQSADVYIINTCSVTQNADSECRSIVNKIQRQAPEAFVIITGCYAQLKPHLIATIPGVDMVIGAQDKFSIVEHINRLSKDETIVQACEITDVTAFTAATSGEERTRVFMKVQDGCDYSCSFCTIPLARGASRSDTIDNVISRIHSAIEAGAQEIIFTGVNLGDFGIDPISRKRTADFTKLVLAIEKEKFNCRFRISSIEPNLLTDEIIDCVSQSTIWMPHFHIPLQSGSNKILKQMRRRYLRESYAARVAYIKQQMPHCCIGVDVITGFPGETDDDFIETYQFLEQLPVSYLHVFTYSERDHTLATTIADAVPPNIRKARTNKLRSLSHLKYAGFIEANRHETHRVLFEADNKNGHMHGFTSNYIKVKTNYNADFINKLIDCNISYIESNNEANIVLLQPQLS
ncbi:MAG: tRNA (N(6)-L-threonylcarbamoyladenosine(37)-C(2))-methylthiotransferase MtaB [Bacteroidetes bacterium]|nr:tRNA (N(6)-L-threonylcarbamoyladenosine(37)-C(2))-methylthiotransferase MtaB [Bacteroidota bacterium]